MTTELLLIRHGQSEGNIGLSKEPDCRLTKTGIDQACRLGARLRDVDLRSFSGICSPYQRAMHTAREIAAVSGDDLQH